jgi:hypothetical protein
MDEAQKSLGRDAKDYVQVVYEADSDFAKDLLQ